ncbi:transcription termination factor MTEF1, chloroplastic [Prosopis cineraria]|uniref:transcription termination factor MTEF1, chloroplastic n=1 Tax=Prosopis cineraria TaxID=364024 RepID=UPI00240FE9EE|nr:transcription termination factor MTEF1, chloroplastic [Prosopis cineraria]
MLHSLSVPSRSLPSRSHSLSANPNPKSTAYYLKFRTTYRENLRYLKILRVIDPQTKPNSLPLPDAVDHILVTVNFLKSRGFSDADFPRLAFLCPQLFSDTFQYTDIAPVFDFLAHELPASVEESCALILRCPNILFSDVEFCLRPSLRFLRQIGVENLNRPTNLTAHLLNTRVEKLRKKITFLQSIGLSYEEAANVCARYPAIFGYGLENNLLPKYEYLVNHMKRSVEELKVFPQYFGFSLEKRIIPRHLHLTQRNVEIPLKRMLMWGDEKFYAKWK